MTEASWTARSRPPEAVQPGHDDRPDGVRYVHVGEPFDHAVATVFPPQDPEIEERLGELLDEQGHPFGFVHKHGLQLLRELLTPQDPPRHGQALGLGEAAQRQCGMEAPAPEGGVYPPGRSRGA